jgi:hypothetical protein
VGRGALAEVYMWLVLPPLRQYRAPSALCMVGFCGSCGFPLVNMQEYLARAMYYFASLFLCGEYLCPFYLWLQSIVGSEQLC